MTRLTADELERLCDIAITECSSNRKGNLSLFHGVSGNALVLYELYSLTGRADVKRILDAAVDYICREISICGDVDFCKGYCGILYMMAYLSGKQYFETDIETFSMFDSIFADYIESLRIKGYYDLQTGLLGFGAYYLELIKLFPEKKAYLRMVIEALLSISRKYEDCIYWPDRQEKHRVFTNIDWANMGHLHGMPSILSFLIACIKRGLWTDELSYIIRQGFNTLFKCMTDDPAYTFVPCLGITEDGLIQEKVRIPTPIFLCNGDFGPINVLYEGGKIFGDKIYLEAARNAFEKLSFRFGNENEYNSVCLCHGWSSLLYFLNRFRELSDTDFSNILENIKTLLFHELSSKKNVNPGLLTGYEGIILSLISSDIQNACIETILML